MTGLLLRVEANQRGRDFVVGDLHGSTAGFLGLLQLIDFNPEIDRMFSVGDLVDRGPDSMSMLRLLKEPWFHAVLGNHEDMMLEAVASNFRSGTERWFGNGGDWAIEPFEENDPEFFELAELADELPLGIIVETNSFGNIGICHAEPPTEWTELCFEIEAQSVLWARKKINSNDSTPPDPNISYSIHGHTVSTEPVYNPILRACWIDLGCSLTGRLCAMQIDGAGIERLTSYVYHDKKAA